MGFGGMGGSQTTEATIPEWIRGPAQNAIARGEDIAKIGYTPWYGPDVAALTADGMAAQANNRAAADAFGLHSGGAAYMQPQDFGSGVWGFGSQPTFQGALDRFAEERPGQFNYINDFFIDPANGGYGGVSYGNSRQAPTGGPGTWDEALAEYERKKAMEREDAARGGGGIAGQGGTGWSAASGGGLGLGLGSYTGFGDMINGGGPGARGPTFQGGGVLSNIANRIATPRGRR